MTQWRKKTKPWENPGLVGGQFSSVIYELEAKFKVTKNERVIIKN